MNMWKLDNNNSSQRCVAIHKQISVYKTCLDDNTLCCAITQLLIIKGQQHREHQLTVSLAHNITMGKVSLVCVVTENMESKKVFWWDLITNHWVTFVDHILRGQKFPGSAPWVHERLCWPPPLLQPLQLHPGGERLLHGVWETPLPGTPVLPPQGGVLWQPAHDWYQRLYPLLPHDSHGKPRRGC